MSQFYAEIKGQARTTASRRGSPKSGIDGHIRGWNIGVRVFGHVDENGKDVFTIYKTSGSNGCKSDKLIKIIKE